MLSVLGGLVLIFALPPSSSSEDQEKTRGLIREVGKVAGEGGLGGWAWDGVGLAVGVGDGDAEEWEDVCAGVGLEFVQLGGKDQAARNEFGGKSPSPLSLSACVFPNPSLFAYVVFCIFIASHDRHLTMEAQWV